MDLYNHKINQQCPQASLLGIFVDDILCLGKSMDLIDWFRLESAVQFSITIKLNVDSFFGMKISMGRPSKINLLSQPGYISALMDKFKIDVTSTTSPMSSSDLIDFSTIKLDLMK